MPKTSAGEGTKRPAKKRGPYGSTLSWKLPFKEEILPALEPLMENSELVHALRESGVSDWTPGPEATALMVIHSKDFAVYAPALTVRNKPILVLKGSGNRIPIQDRREWVFRQPKAEQKFKVNGENVEVWRCYKRKKLIPNAGEVRAYGSRKLGFLIYYLQKRQTDSGSGEGTVANEGSDNSADGDCPSVLKKRKIDDRHDRPRDALHEEGTLSSSSGMASLGVDLTIWPGNWPKPADIDLALC